MTFIHRYSMEEAMKALMRILILLIVWNLIPLQAGDRMGPMRSMETKGQRQERLFRFIADRSRFYRFELSLIHSVIDVESVWDEKAESPEEAIGLMQVQVPTARLVMHIRHLTKRDLKDPFLNVEAGLRELSKLRRIFHGDLELALLSYNRGIARVLDDLDAGRDPRNKYATNILRTR